MRRVSRCAALLLTALLLVSAAGATGAASLTEGGQQAVSDASRQQNEGPTAAFTYAPENPKPGEAVRLNGSPSSDPDGEIAEYQWDLNGDGQTETTGGPNARVAFPSAGVYEVTLTVVDNDGASDSVTNEIVVAGNISPTASLSVSTSEVKVGQALTFNATGSNDPDGRIVEWAFDLYGNGTFDRTFDSPPIFRTNYREAGTYDVTLRVTDNDGLTDTTTVEVVVQAVTPDTVTRTVTVTGATSTATTRAQVGDEPDAGGPGLLSQIPGGGLTIAALAIVLLLLIVGGALYTRGSGDSRRGRRQQPSSGRSPVTGFVLALLVTVVLVGGPVLGLRSRLSGAAAANTDIVLSFVQLAGLVLPALMLVLFVWFQLSEPGGQRGETTIGPLSAGGFRVLGTVLGYLALVFLVIALAGLLLVLDLSAGVSIAAALIAGAIGLVAFALAILLVFMLMG